MATAALVTVSFPDFGCAAAAWIALVPLAAACEGSSFGAAFGFGLLAGTTATLAKCAWIFEVPHVGVPQACSIALYLGLYPAAWCAGLVALRGSRTWFVPGGAALWVALAFLRAHAGFLAISWTTLAQSQHADLALLQLAGLTGAAGVTFVVVMANLALETGVMRRRWTPLVVAIAVVAILHLAGAVSLAGSASHPSFEVAVVQPAITRREAETRHGWALAQKRLDRLTRRAATSLPKPALIVWPETAVRNLGGGRALAKRLEGLADAEGIPIILGSSDVQTSLTWSASGIRIDHPYRDAAWMIPVHGVLPAPYFKMVLIPFVEYRPFVGWARWTRWLSPVAFDTLPGHRRTLFRMDGGVRVAPIICWENLFAGRVRRSVADGAQVIVQLVNDNWFGRSAEPQQHALASVMRAVENRVPVIVASNTGPSEIVGRTGRILAKGPSLFASGFLTARVIPSAGSPYSSYGDVFAWLCLVAALLAMGWASSRWLRGGNMAGQRPGLKGRSSEERDHEQ